MLYLYEHVTLCLHVSYLNKVSGNIFIKAFVVPLKIMTLGVFHFLLRVYFSRFCETWNP